MFAEDKMRLPLWEALKLYRDSLENRLHATQEQDVYIQDKRNKNSVGFFNITFKEKYLAKLFIPNLFKKT